MGFILTSRLAQLTYTVVNEMNEMSENDVSQKVKYVLRQMLLGLLRTGPYALLTNCRLFLPAARSCLAPRH
eukprot:COSAG02_NODE_4644_length_5137_cov_1.950377_4_plen_71_part_00